MTVRPTLDDILPWLPDMLRELAERFGLGVALKLSAEFGGRNVYIPKRASPSHPIARIIGPAPFAALCRKYGGAHVDIPLGLSGQQRRRAMEIARLDDRRKSANEIAGLVGCHQRTVFYHRRKRRDGTAVDARQKRLF